MAAAIQKKFGASAELVRRDNGIFNVFVDGDQIWDKHESGRFPEEKEILQSMAGRN